MKLVNVWLALLLVMLDREMDRLTMSQSEKERNTMIRIVKCHLNLNPDNSSYERLLKMQFSF